MAIEFAILRVDRSYRVVLPQSLVQQMGWITGASGAWLLLGSPGRCRLLSEDAVANSKEFQSLQERIASEASAQASSGLEFQDDSLVALSVRLAKIQISPPGPAWRLTLPKYIAAIMQVRPGESDVAAGLIQGHIEIWTIETLRSSVSTPLIEII